MWQYIIISWALCLLACMPKSRPENTAQTTTTHIASAKDGSPTVRTGAAKLIANQLSLVKGQSVGLVANHTARLPDSTHLLDALLAKGITVKRIFVPEHGFRGTAEAGQKVQDSIDAQTGLPIVSLYDRNKKPKAVQMADLSVIIFDIQDVGTRFYTYLTTLVMVMEACAKHDKQLIVLDRPNPNGRYVDGPILDLKHRSFVGWHPIPIVHGMTLGEYAQMVNGERWLSGQRTCKLQVVAMEGYKRTMRWAQTGLPWIPPSPNLRTPEAAEWYPILCWYEGTMVSVGRGTETPFTLAGFPHHQAARKQLAKDSILHTQTSFTIGSLSLEAVRFTPRSMPTMAADPMYRNTTCYGYRILGWRDNTQPLFRTGIQLLANLYHEHQTFYTQNAKIPPFFNSFFDNLSGTESVRQAIIDGKSADDIYASWQPDVQAFRSMRKRYLIYPNE